MDSWVLYTLMAIFSHEEVAINLSQCDLSGVIHALRVSKIVWLKNIRIP